MTFIERLWDENFEEQPSWIQSDSPVCKSKINYIIEQSLSKKHKAGFHKKRTADKDNVKEYKCQIIPTNNALLAVYETEKALSLMVISVTD